MANSPKRGKPTLKVVYGGSQATALTSEEREYFRTLHKVIDAIYSEAANQYDLTWKQLAEHANLSYETVRKLGDRETHYPRFFTIIKLAKVVGWKLVLTEDSGELKKGLKVVVREVA